MSKKITANFLNNYGFFGNGVNDFEIRLKGFLFLSIDISGEKISSGLFSTKPATGRVDTLISVELETKKDIKNFYKYFTGKELKKNKNKFITEEYLLSIGFDKIQGKEKTYYYKGDNYILVVLSLRDTFPTGYNYDLSTIYGKYVVRCRKDLEKQYKRLTDKKLKKINNVR